MTQKAKTFFIISITFIIGILLGMSLSSTLHQRRLENIRRMSYQERFDELIRRIIKPTKEQQIILKEIIDQRSKQIDQLREQQHEDVMALFDSLRIELNSALTEEQRELLEQEMQKGLHRPFDWHLEKLTRELALTEKQKEKLRQVFLEFSQKHDFRRRPDFRGKRPRREAFEKRMKSMQKLEQEIEKILTPAQLEQFKNIKRPFPFGGPGKPFGLPGKHHGPPRFQVEEN